MHHLQLRHLLFIYIYFFTKNKLSRFSKAETHLSQRDRKVALTSQLTTQRIYFNFELSHVKELMIISRFNVLAMPNYSTITGCTFHKPDTQACLPRRESISCPPEQELGDLSLSHQLLPGFQPGSWTASIQCVSFDSAIFVISTEVTF